MMCRILYAEDSKYFYRLLRGKEIPDEGIEIVWVTRAADMLSELKKATDPACADEPYDCLLLDLGLPDSAGIDTYKKVVESYAIPTIIITGVNDISVINECKALGAKEVFVKGDMDESKVADKIIQVISDFKPSLLGQVKAGLTKLSRTAKESGNLAAGYTTGVINSLIVGSCLLDAYVQVKTTGNWHIQEWQTQLFALALGGKSIKAITDAVKK